MAHETEHTSNHPSFKQYVLIAIILFAITIVEFLLIWDKAGIVDSLGATKIPLLVGLSAVKFAIVIMFYMHLKFDNRLLGTIFISGLALAFLVGIALLGLFVAFEGNQRIFAEVRAVPYVEPDHKPEPTTGAPVAPGPIAFEVGEVGETLTFASESMSVTSGDEVTITFTNPSANNQHNFVIVQGGTKDAVAADGAAAGPGNGWLAPGDTRVIASSDLLDPGTTGEITFTAPEPGAYQFVCTFPGHSITMFGAFLVN